VYPGQPTFLFYFDLLLIMQRLDVIFNLLIDHVFLVFTLCVKHAAWNVFFVVWMLSWLLNIIIHIMNIHVYIFFWWLQFMHWLCIWIDKEHEMFAFKIFWCKIIEILSRAKFFFIWNPRSLSLKGSIPVVLNNSWYELLLM
jgi:hypothetical protein